MLMNRLRIGFLLGLAVLIIDAAVPLLLAHRVARTRDEFNDAVTRC